MGLRRKGRELALQTLYSLGYSEADSYLKELEYLNIYKDKLLETAEENHFDADSKGFEFADNLIANTIKNMMVIDKEIEKHLINWNFERVAELDKNILRIAVYEMKFTDTPAAIVMNEAIEVAKKFCSENSGKFINGILNSIKADLDK